MKEERTVRDKLEQDLDKAMTKIAQMVKNLEEKEEKYLKLYEENVIMHEKLTEFSSRQGISNNAASQQ